MIPIEETVFSRKRWIESKMLAYGFHKANKTYILEKPFLDGDFKTVLSVTPKGQVTGKVIDTITQDEYYQLRQETATGPYVNRVRSAYRSLLTDIADSCCSDVLFASSQANRLAQGDELRPIPGIYPAYHMNHKTWISVVLDETLPDEKILELIDTSYQLTTTSA